MIVTMTTSRFVLIVLIAMPMAILAFASVPVPLSLEVPELQNGNGQHSTLTLKQDSSESHSTMDDSEFNSTSESAAIQSLSGERKTLSITPAVNRNQQLLMAASVFSGSVVTFALNNFLPFGPIPAASTVGIIATTLLPERFALAAFCGAFAGMARLAVVPGFRPALVLGTLCASIFALFDKQKWLVGIGGRLGLIAQIACTTQFLFSSIILPPFPGGAKFIGSYPPLRMLLSELLPTCLHTVFGALVMSIWMDTMKMKAQKNKSHHRVAITCNRLSTSVAAVSATGLVASLIPVISAGPAFSGSLIAMSSPLRIETYGGLVGASLVGGLCQIALSSVLLGGWGGKLGTASLLGVLGFSAIRVTWQGFHKHHSQDQTYSN